MSDNFEERALRNLRKRHRDAIRRAALDIQNRAGYILREADDFAGAGILSGSLVDQAVEIDRRIAALEAISDATGIYESAAPAEPTATTPGGESAGARENTR